VARRIATHLADYPPVVPDEYRPGDTVWMVTEIPHWFWRLLGAKQVTYVIEIRPLRPDLFHPTGNKRIPRRLTRAIEEQQSPFHEPRLLTS
jgi:hypothetical protein